MSNDDHWIKTRIADARGLQDSLVTEAVSSKMNELLAGQLSERQLSSTELSDLAKLLIAAMVPESLKASKQ